MSQTSQGYLFCYSPWLLPSHGGKGEELLSTSTMRNIPKEANSEAEIKRLCADANKNHSELSLHTHWDGYREKRKPKKQKVTTAGVNVEKPCAPPMGTCYVPLL